MNGSGRHLLDLRGLSREEIARILDTAASFKEVSAREVKKVPALRGKTVVLLFFEPSTRTRVSFELAAKRLSADTISITAAASSSSKGETLLDTARNIEAMNVDAVVVRHRSAGVPEVLSRRLGVSVVNAGDGCRAHPTQALLDLFTIRERCGRIAGLRVGIVGDIRHSRVARSDIWGLTCMGAEVTVCGPAPLIPEGITAMGVRVSYDFDDLLRRVDVLILLRIQRERQREAFFPSIREYTALFGLTPARLAAAGRRILVMHPGPVNRGIELSGEIADGPDAVILEQVTNGVAVRMAVLYLLLGARKE